MSKRLSPSLIRPFACIAGFAVALAAPISAFAEDYTLNLNKTQILHLPTAAAAVVIGNPSIADVSVHSADTLFMVGRGYGETNLIVLDKDGRTILDANILVKGDNAGIRLLKMGEGRETYSCTPYCAPAPILGDSAQFVSKYKGRVEFMNNAPVSGALYSSNGSAPVSQTSFSATGPSYAGPPPEYSNEAPPGADYGPPPE